ncbi:MAG: hypothetical protein ACO1PN_15950 [Betaproteobacteria bacterium]
MSKDDDVMSRGRLKGQKIAYAATDRVDEFRLIASEFMDEIFELMPGEYLISDESDVHDFTDFGSSDTSGIWERIKDVYGFKESAVDSSRLVDVFAEIARRRNLQ